MSSERYSETRSFRETNRNNSTDNSRLKFPNDERVNLPIQQTINRFNQSTNEQRLQERLRHQETTLQWVNDPVSGQEKFRINVNIDGFNQNEVNVRVEGNRLHVFGEHLETKDQSTAKKIIEKTYDLPRDIDTYGYQVTFPSVTLMQIDFPSRHSNVIIDDGRLSSRLVTDYDSTLRTSPGITKERTSSEYTSTRKIGGGGGGSSTLQNPRSNSLYDNLSNRSTAFSTTNDYQIPVNRDFTNSSAFNNTTTSNYQNPVSRDFTNSSAFNNTTTSNYQIPVSRDFTNSSSFNNSTTNNYQPRSTYPSTSRGENNVVREQTYSETHRETEHRRSSPTSGVQTSREVEHHRSGSPSLGRTLDENRFRTTLNLGNSTSISPSSSSRNIEVREFSRRVGSNGGVGTETNLNLEPIRFSSSFNSDAFYRSAFQPQIFTDNSGQQRIEMKLDVSNYQPSEIKVAIEGEDLVVRAEHSVDRPPTTSSRNFFFKQITLPPNTDFKSLASKHYPDGTLHITAKLN